MFQKNLALMCVTYVIVGAFARLCQNCLLYTSFYLLLNIGEKYSSFEHFDQLYRITFLFLLYKSMIAWTLYDLSSFYFFVGFSHTLFVNFYHFHYHLRIYETVVTLLLLITIPTVSPSPLSLLSLIHI